MPGRAEGRQKRRYEPDHERVACPCSRCVESGGEPVTKRTMRRHLSEEPIKRGPDDLDPGGDVDPESQVGDDQAGVEQPSMWSDPTLASPFLASAGPMTFGAIITLMLALQLRFHLTGLSMVTVCEAMICASLALLPLMKMRRQFKALSTPPVRFVHLCPNGECVAFVNEHEALRRCPVCQAHRYKNGSTPAPLAPFARAAQR